MHKAVVSLNTGLEDAETVTVARQCGWPPRGSPER
jgi:hypothetical protein